MTLITKGFFFSFLQSVSQSPKYVRILFSIYSEYEVTALFQKSVSDVNIFFSQITIGSSKCIDKEL